MTNLRTPRLARLLLAALVSAVTGAALLTGTATSASAAGPVRLTFSNTGCRTATVYWDNGGTLVSYGTVAGKASTSVTTYPGHRWVLKVGTMTVGSRTVGTTSSTKRFDSFGCVAFTGRFAADHSGKCLNVPGFATASGTRIIQYTCGNGASNERFRAVTAPGGYMLQNVNSGRCLTVPGASTTPGTGVVQSGCSYMRRQILVLGADGSMAFRHSGQCVDVYGASTADHTPIIQWPCNGQGNQRWRAF